MLGGLENQSSVPRATRSTSGREKTNPDFLVSYTRGDERWAERIGWLLEAPGHRVTLVAWDFGPGADSVAEMREAFLACDCTRISV